MCDIWHWILFILYVWLIWTIDVSSKTSEKYVKQQRRERLKFKRIHIYTLITCITKHCNYVIWYSPGLDFCQQLGVCFGFFVVYCGLVVQELHSCWTLQQHGRPYHIMHMYLWRCLCSTSTHIWRVYRPAKYCFVLQYFTLTANLHQYISSCLLSNLDVEYIIVCTAAAFNKVLHLQL